MLHKKLKMWLQFGGHSDGDIDTFETAKREFFEESGIQVEPTWVPEAFFVDVHDIPPDAKWRPRHNHHDILYIGYIDETIPFSRQVEEVDDMRWFPIDSVESYVDANMMLKINKIKSKYA